MTNDTPTASALSPAARRKALRSATAARKRIEKRLTSARGAGADLYADDGFVRARYREALYRIDDALADLGTLAGRLRGAYEASGTIEFASAERLSRAVSFEGEPLREVDSELWYTAALATGVEKASSFHEVPNVDEVPISACRPTPHVDALSQAVAIARSASGDEIDWGREPITDREARIRRVWLDRQLDRVHSSGWLRIAALVLNLHGRRPPADLAAANEEASRLVDEHRAAEQRAQFREIGDELDDDAA